MNWLALWWPAVACPVASFAAGALFMAWFRNWPDEP